MKIQNLIVNSKSKPVQSNSKQYQLLFKYVSSKINNKIFEINEDTRFCGNFCAKGIFPKNSG